MKLENQVCKLEQAKQLKELGIKTAGVYCYASPVKSVIPTFDGESTEWAAEYDDDNVQVMQGCWASFEGLPHVSTFTVAELGQMLPRGSGSGRRISPFDGWTANYEHAIGSRLGETEAEARANLLIYLLEEGEITPEEANQRLLGS